MAIKPAELNISHIPLVDWLEGEIDKHIKTTRSLKGDFYLHMLKEDIKWPDVRNMVVEELIKRYHEAGWDQVSFSLMYKSECVRNETETSLKVTYRMVEKVDPNAPQVSPVRKLDGGK